MVEIQRKKTYIRKGGFDKKGDLKQKYQKDISTKEKKKKKKKRERKRKREREREKKVNSVTICTILASPGKFMEGYMPLYSIKLTFSSLS